MSPAKIPPKPGKDVVYIDVDDEITGIIDKVENAKEKVVALVLPKRAAMLQSIINMRLLARGSKNASKNVVLITSETALMPLAGAAGIHVAKNLQSTPEIPAAPESLASPAEKKAAEPETKTAPPLKVKESDDDSDEPEEKLPQKIDYSRSVGELAAVHEADNPETIALDDDEEEESVAPVAAKPKKDKSLKVPNFDRFRMLLVLGAVAFVALIVFIILAIFVLPKATITLQTTSTPVNASLSASTSGSAKTLDETNKVIPSVSKTSDQTSTAQATATGQQNNGDKATGTATISGGACTGNVPSDIPGGTGVSTNGLTYITQKTASFSPVVSGGKCTFQSNQVPITSQTGGTKYNTSFSSASVAGYPSVSASGSASGGSDNVQTVLTQADVDGAVSKATAGGTDAHAKSFENQLASQGFYVFTSTMQVSTPSATASPSVGQQASTATISIKITYTVMAVQKSDLSKFITDQMNGKIDKTKQKLSTNLLNDADISVTNQSSPTDSTLSIQENTTAVPIIDVNSVKQMAKGQKSGTLTSALESRPGVKSVKVKLSPFWVSKVPGKTSKITVILEEVKSS
jgi:hypothetical protein